MNQNITSNNINVSKVCRTCLEEGNELISLYQVDMNSGLQICEMILNISQVQVFNKDNTPSSICSDCHYKLNISFQFQQQCKNSDLKLQEFMRNYQNETNVNEKEIEAAVQEFFGNETSEQDMNYQPNMVLSGDLDTNLKASDLLNMDIILGEKSPKKVPKKSKFKPKGKQHLDELLKTHKERMKIENSSKIQIFKQKRKKKVTALTEPEQCFQCGKVFHYKGYMETHLRTHSNYKAYECNVCNKRFTQISNLNLHLRTHSKERPFQCEKCPKMFSTSSNLKAHGRIHLNYKPFQCSLCSRAFKSTTELKSHEGIHSQIKTKVCKYCGKSFYKTSYLNVHIKNIHFGLKKYQCDGCSKSFSNSSNLIAHKRVHSGEKPYVCKFDDCTAKFNQSSSLVRHMKSHNRVAKVVKVDSEKVTQPTVQVQSNQEPMKPVKKTPYIIPELLKDINISDSSSSDRIKSLPSCQQQNYVPAQQPLLPEALNPMNLIGNSTTSNYNSITNHSTQSLLLPLPPTHETAPVADHSIHHFPNFENTTYLPTTPNILPNSFNFIMGSLDFSKNSLNGEPTYIDY